MNIESQFKIIGEHLKYIRKEAKVSYLSYSFTEGDAVMYSLSFRLEGENIRNTIDFFDFKSLENHLQNIITLIESGEALTSDLMTDEHYLQNKASFLTLSDRW